MRTKSCDECSIQSRVYRVAFVASFVLLATKPIFAAEFIPLGWLAEPPWPNTVMPGSREVLISDDGLVISGESPNTAGVAIPSRWTRETGMVALDDEEKSSMKTVSGMESDDLVPWIWSEQIDTLNLLKVLDQQGLGPAIRAWDTLIARPTNDVGRISADGRAIIGSGTNPDGFREAWVAYLDPIPEPSSLLLAAAWFVGAVLVLRRLLQRQGTRAVVVTAMMCVTLVGTALAAEFVPVQNLEGTKSAWWVTAISDDGSVAIGSARFPDQPSRRPYRWTRETGMVILDDGPHQNALVLRNTVNTVADGSIVAWSNPVFGGAPTKVWTEATGVVSLGTNVGHLMSSDGSVVAGPECCIPKRWTADNGVEELDQGSIRARRVFGLSADGSVVVGSTDLLPVRWTENGLIPLGSVSGHETHAILGMSADASIVYGLSEASMDGTDSRLGFINENNQPNSLWRWTEATGIEVLEEGSTDRDLKHPLLNDSFFVPGAKAVSADGTVVVGGTGEGLRGFDAIFRWTEDGGIELLKLDPAYRKYTYETMTPDGRWLMGDAYAPVDPADELSRPWLWSEATGVIDMIGLFRAQGLDSAIDGWSAFRPRVITPDARVIGGHGINPDGDEAAWVAYVDPIIIPEPSSLLLGALALAGVGLVFCRRRCRRVSRVAHCLVILLSLATTATTHAAEFISLGTPSRALSISDDGTVISGSDFSTSSTGDIVFRWTRETGKVVIGDDNSNVRPVMSADGSVVVWRAFGTENARVWSVDNGLIEFDLEFVTFGENPLADEAISHDGSVIVGNVSPLLACSPKCAVRWSADDGFVELGFNVQDLLVSSDATMVAGTPRSESQGASGPPFRWTAAEGLTSIGEVVGDNFYRITGISADGAVISGVSWAHANPGDRNSARGPGNLWRWTLSEGLTVLADGTSDGSFTPQQFSAGRWLSADGSVLVGNRGALASTIDLESFRWTEESGIQPLLGLPGFPRSVVLDMTPDGTWVFGQSYVDTLGGELAPWLWSEATGTLNLLEVFDSQGLASSFEGWNSLWNGVGNRGRISGDGRAIIGTGSNPGGITEGWVIHLDPLVIPEPSSLLLSFAGLGGALLLRRR